MDKGIYKSVDSILCAMQYSPEIPLSLKDDKGVYIYANETWAELAEAPPHRIVGHRDNQLPWGDPSNNQFNWSMDAATRTKGVFKSSDRRPHFTAKYWINTDIEKVYIRDERVIASVVKVITEQDKFCILAERVNEKGINIHGLQLSIKQLYLAHQLLFHVPHKQTAREMGCSSNRVNQSLQEIKEMLDAEDSRDLICRLSALGLFPLLEHFELVLRHGWVSSEFLRR
jgi:DNA-binding CsgD family transcriptional regulator